MRPVLRSRPLRSPVLAIAVLALAVLVAPPAGAEEEAGPAAGDTVVGELVQAYADPQPAGTDDPHDGLLSWIETAAGETTRVPTEDLGDVEAGATLAVTLGADVADDAADQGLEPAQEVLATEVVAPPEEPPTAPAAGPVNHPVTVVMLQPAGVNRDATTLASVEDLVNGPVADFWEQQTRGAVTFGVAGSVDWGAPATVGCDKPFQLWQQAAARANWTPTSNSHLLVYLPAGAPGCSDGLGTVGTASDGSARAYVALPNASVITHEFGHNLGLGHSSALQCDAAVDSGSCQVVGYSDYYDVMGYSWQQLGTLNVVQAERLGLVRPQDSVVFTPWTAGADVVLAPVSTATPATGLYRAVELVDADGTQLWLEYRQASGQDAWLADPARNRGLQQGVTLRRAAASGDTSLLLDGTPSARAGWAGDRAVVLTTGSPVTVAGTRFTVRVVATSASGATVRITTLRPTAAVHSLAGGDAGPQGTLTEAEACDADNRCLARYQGARVFWSPTTGGHSVAAPELARWEDPATDLGFPVGDRRCGLRDSGCFQGFEHGGVYTSPATGTHAVSWEFYDRWAATGWEFGSLGYPVGDESCTMVDGGCYQHFQRGTVVAGPGGTWAISGGLRDGWFSSGSELGYLGYPTGAAVCGLRAGGCFQPFEGGPLYWSPTTGGHGVAEPVYGRWAATGWEFGSLGYPVSDTVCGLRDGGCFQHFQGGSVYWSSASGARVVSGAVRGRWAGQGWEGGGLGYPVTDTVCGLRDGGCFQHFQGGSVYWSSASGARVVSGAVRGRWAGQGWEGGGLGYPVTDTVCGLRDGGCFQHFQGGSVYSSPVTGAWAVSGPVGDRWAASGWETGPLGYPVAETVCGLRDGGCFQHFRGGSVYWSPGAGAWAVSGPIRDRWAASGWEFGPLGYPVRPQVCRDTGACYQDFQGGRLSATVLR